MRSALTSSEAALWVLLRGGQLGVWFRRQVPLGRFVADFAAARRGSSSRSMAAIMVGVARPMRTVIGRCLGYRVLRLEASLVTGRPPEAFARAAHVSDS